MKATLLLLTLLPVLGFAKLRYAEAPLWQHADNPTNYYKQAITPADTSLPDSNKTTATTPPPAEQQQAAAKEEAPKEKKSAKDIMKKLRFGGYIGGSFGTYNSIEVAPMVGYMLTEKLMVGVGFSVYYTWRKNPDIEEWLYGPRFFARYDLFEGFFLHTEYEIISYPNTKIDLAGNTYTDREAYGSFLVGGGIQRGHFGVTALYIVNYDEDKSPYVSPWVIRFGILL